MLTNPPKFSRARVAISTPKSDPDVKDCGRFAIHVGHAQTLYAGYKLARQHGCPFHVRLDGSIKHFRSDLSLFMLDIVECLRFLDIRADRLYWQRQEEYSPDFMARHFSCDAQGLLHFIQWDRGAIDVCAILDDVEHAPSLIVRGNEFQNPEDLVGRAFISQGVRWFRDLEKKVFELAGVHNTEINVPLITMGGYKLSKEEGRVIHWRVLETIGLEASRSLFDKKLEAGENWEWSWGVVGANAASQGVNRPQCRNCGQKFSMEAERHIHESECERRAIPK